MTEISCRIIPTFASFPMRLTMGMRDRRDFDLHYG
ncbi:hypothetical protein DSTSK_38210 [Desulforhabdus sp. TSK]|nr:hypothetical protein DSTSK_38210 [Desulforhabdus sp. TSK]